MMLARQTAAGEQERVQRNGLDGSNRCDVKEPWLLFSASRQADNVCSKEKEVLFKGKQVMDGKHEKMAHT